MDNDRIIPYIEPIFRFCCKRLENRYDAEDLASEIICYILDGLGKYEIKSLDAWVWRIAHNRYARFIHARKKNQELLAGEDALADFADFDYCLVDEEAEEQEFEEIFRYLHMLSAEYRDIFIDHYIGEMPIRDLSKKYSLSETTVKWRLNVGRQKIRDRIGENHMDKVYKRIYWNTTCCNGCFDADQYLHKQLARAICLAAYEKPLTVEEISMSTGVPAMYIEDELPYLEYGDAVCKIGKKYATNFIIFRQQDRKATESVSMPLVEKLSDALEKLLKEKAAAVCAMDFYGHDFGMDRLGHIIVPYILRRKIRTVKSRRLKLENGPYPPRKDGGYGWYIVEETADSRENSAESAAGCNVAGDDSGSRYALPSKIYYYWISKYFDNEIYHNKGTRWLCANGIPQNSKAGMVGKDALAKEDAARLIQNNLLLKSDDSYQLNFSCFTEEQFAKFIGLFVLGDESMGSSVENSIEDALAEWILAVRKNFESFVPDRLDDQINQWVSGYLYQIIGYVIDEMICRGVLRKPKIGTPFTDGVFYVEGGYIDP